MSNLERRPASNNEFQVKAEYDYFHGIVEKAQKLSRRTGSSLENAVDTILRFTEAKRNARPADPNEPIRAFITSRHGTNN